MIYFAKLGYQQFNIIALVSSEATREWLFVVTHVLLPIVL